MIAVGRPVHCEAKLALLTFAQSHAHRARRTEIPRRTTRLLQSGSRFASHCTVPVETHVVETCEHTFGTSGVANHVDFAEVLLTWGPLGATMRALKPLRRAMASRLVESSQRQVHLADAASHPLPDRQLQRLVHGSTVLRCSPLRRPLRFLLRLAQTQRFPVIHC